MIQRITLPLVLLSIYVVANAAPADGRVVTASRHTVLEASERAVAAML